MLSSLLSAAYLMPVIARAFFRPPAPEPASAGAARAGGGIREAPVFCLIAMAITSAGTFILFFFAGDIADLLAPIVAP
jgi:multicomponent Na+:H+ antiporter subunit D